MRILIKNVSVFDGFSPNVKKNAWISIEENLVKEIGNGEINESAFDQVIDGGGRTAIPGLVECHGHMTGWPSKLERDQMRADEIVIHSVRNAKNVLMSGFTTVRDAGSLIYGLKKGIDSGIVDGPRIFSSNSALSQTCGHGDCRTNHAEIKTIVGHTSPYMRAGIMTTCDGMDEITRTVREQFFYGASQIKVMTGGGMSTMMDPLETLQFTPAEQKLIVELARDYGTYVMAHLYTPAQIKRSAEAGIKSFEHATFMDDDSGRIIADVGGWICPCPNKVHPEARRRASNRNPAKLKFFDKMEATIANQAEIINKYNLEHLVFGTDGHPAPALDLSSYQDRFGALNGLRAATGNAKELFKLCTYQNPYPDGYIGTLETGSYADVLIMDGNPLEDLHLFDNLDNIRLIMKDAKIYKNTLGQ